MTRINLLPPEIKGKAEKVNIVPWVIVSLLVVIAVVGGLWFYFHSQVSDREDKLKAAQRDLTDLKKTVEEPLQAFEAQAAELKKVQDLYSACNAGRVGWASMLNDLALYVPEGLTTASNPTAPAIWLTHLAIDATALDGHAADKQHHDQPHCHRGVRGTRVAVHSDLAAAGQRLQGARVPRCLPVLLLLPRAAQGGGVLRPTAQYGGMEQPVDRGIFTGAYYLLP